MGILKRFLGGIVAIGDYILNIGNSVLRHVESFFGIKHKLPTEEIRRRLREQWLALKPEEKDIPGVEVDGETFYETPR